MANVLRDDGVSYGDYLEQITYLLFLKMADEMNRPPYNKGLRFPHLKDAEGKEIADGEMCDWETLTSKRGAELEALVRRRVCLGKFIPRARTRFKTLPNSCASLR
jgi:type I restriction enzyme M protein